MPLMAAKAGHSTRCESAGGTAIFLPTRSFGVLMLALLRKNTLLPALSYTTATIFRLAPLLIAVSTVGASADADVGLAQVDLLRASAEPLPRSTVRSMFSSL